MFGRPAYQAAVRSRSAPSDKATPESISRRLMILHSIKIALVRSPQDATNPFQGNPRFRFFAQGRVRRNGRGFDLHLGKRQWPIPAVDRRLNQDLPRRKRGGVVRGVTGFENAWDNRV